MSLLLLFQAPPATGPIEIQSPGATTTFSAVTTVSEVVNSVPANVTYSSPVNKAAIAPQVVAALTTFSTGTNSVAELLSAVPASVTFSNPTTAQWAPKSTTPPTVTFSGVSTLAELVNPPPASTTFGTGTTTAQIIAPIPSAGLVTFSGIASIAGLPVSNTSPGSTVTFSMPVPTVVESLQAVPGNTTFSSPVNKAQLQPQVTAAITTFSAVVSVGESVNTVPANVTFSSGTQKLQETVGPVAGTTTFSGVATAAINLRPNAGSTTFSSLAKTALSTTTPVGSFTASGANVSVIYDLGIIPGFAECKIIKASYADILVIPSATAEMRIIVDENLMSVD